MAPFLASLAFVFLAELGDKTQLLAMALAVRYRWTTVLAGIIAATAANHLLAVAAGKYLTVLVPLHWVKIAAAVAFILFGLWTLRGDSLEGEEDRSNGSPFRTVFIAFFLAEMGDKTQLATMALAADYGTVVPVWFGSVSGMVAADALGIIVGVLLGRRLPERAIKWTAALIFILFGLWSLFVNIWGQP